MGSKSRAGIIRLTLINHQPGRSAGYHPRGPGSVFTVQTAGSSWPRRSVSKAELQAGADLPN